MKDYCVIANTFRKISSVHEFRTIRGQDGITVFLVHVASELSVANSKSSNLGQVNNLLIHFDKDEKDAES